MPIRAVLLLLLASSALLLGEAAGELFTQEKCSLCHILESRFLETGTELSRELKREGEERVCESCHNGTVQDHRDTLWRGSQHPSPRVAGKGPCSVCHSPHGTGGWKVLAGTGIPIRGGGNALCLSCHKAYDPRSSKLHRNGFPEGGCQECHRAHGGAGPSLLAGSEGALCLRCHKGMDSSPKVGHAWNAKRRDASGDSPPPTCTSCHPVHREGPGHASPAEICARCHAEHRSPAPEGAALHPGVSDCLACHTVHARTGDSGRAFRGEDMVPERLCGKCHPGAVAGSAGAAREKGSHVSAPEGKNSICFECHRIHFPAPGTGLLATGKPYFCLDCHREVNPIPQTGEIVLAHPVFEHVARGRLEDSSRKHRIRLGPLGELVCRTCHVLHGAEPKGFLFPKGTSGEESCLWCHEGMSGKEHRSAAVGTVNASCIECHPIHGIRKPGEARAGPGPDKASDDPWGELCRTCHDPESRHVGGKENRTVPRDRELPTFDALGRRAGSLGAVSCPTCHDPHGVPERKGRLRKPYEPSGFLCTGCHRDKETVALTPHDLRGIVGKSICDPCHLPHGGVSPWMWRSGTVPGPGGESACRECHGAKGLGSPVPGGGHPVNLVVPRPLPDAFPLFGPDGRTERNGILSCPTCHEPHGIGILPSGEGTGKLLRSPGVSGTGGNAKNLRCLPCHEGRGTAHGGGECSGCHPPHDDSPPSAVCSRCHEETDRGIASRHRKSGKTCGACHTLHGPSGTAGGEAACTGCHPAAKRIERSAHGELGSGTCSSCHPPHAEPEPFRPQRRAWEEDFLPDLACIRCHGEGRDAPLPPGGNTRSTRKRCRHRTGEP